jgi:hypothetical protein
MIDNYSDAPHTKCPEILQQSVLSVAHFPLKFYRSRLKIMTAVTSG